MIKIFNYSLLITLVILFFSCSAEDPIINREPKIDTLYVEIINRDTVFVTDSIYDEHIVTCDTSYKDTLEGYTFKKYSFLQFTYYVSSVYKNPVTDFMIADPSFIRAKDGMFYLYSFTSIYKSKDLVHWKYLSNIFEDGKEPDFFAGDVWAVDINYFNGNYVLYYALSMWGETKRNGIGVAVSKTPEGPFVDKGKLFTSEEIGVVNSIDPDYYEDDGKKYLVWGSFNGIFCIELNDDGLSVKDGAEKIQIGGRSIEGAYIHKRNGFYYLFGSTGSCCRAEKSTYITVCARSTSFLGDYVDKGGTTCLRNYFSPIIKGNEYVAGPGHNGEIITDDNGQDWILYHGWDMNNLDAGRVLFLDKVHWENDWPVVENGTPSTIIMDKPFFK